MNYKIKVLVGVFLVLNCSCNKSRTYDSIPFFLSGTYENMFGDYILKFEAERVINFEIEAENEEIEILRKSGNLLGNSCLILESKKLNRLFNYKSQCTHLFIIDYCDVYDPRNVRLCQYSGHTGKFQKIQMQNAFGDFEDYYRVPDSYFKE